MLKKASFYFCFIKFSLYFRYAKTKLLYFHKKKTFTMANNTQRASDKKQSKYISNFKCLDWVLSRKKSTVYTRRQLGDMLSTVTNSYKKRTSQYGKY